MYSVTYLEENLIFDRPSKVCTLLVIFGLMVRRTIGVSDYWVFGTNGASEYWDVPILKGCFRNKFLHVSWYQMGIVFLTVGYIQNSLVLRIIKSDIYFVL